MENSDFVPPDYIEKFNVGYTYSFHFPDFSIKVLEQNNITNPDDIGKYNYSDKGSILQNFYSL